MVTGFDFNRLNIIIAVLEKRLGIYMGTLDVYLNIVGGFRLDEPAGDLPVAMALYSAVMDKQIDESLIAFGEIGLGGEIRSVSHISQRIREAERTEFNGRDHSTIVYSVNSVADGIKKDPNLKNLVNDIIKNIKDKSKV